MCESRASMRSRTIPDVTVGFRLTDRDRAVIATVALHGAATRRQLVGLGFFQSVSRANRRLRLLFDTRYVRRTFLAEGAYAAETVYLLGPSAKDVATTATGLDYVDISRQAARLPARTFLEHQLLSLQVCLAVRRACSRSDVRLLRYLPEPLCRHEYISGRDHRMVKPDAFVLVADGSTRLAAFVEVDRGCVSASQLTRTFERYRLYLRDGAFADCYRESTFQVLLVTTAGKRRIEHLKRLTKADQLPLVRFATLEEVAQNGFLGAIWQRNGSTITEPLLTRLEARR